MKLFHASEHCIPIFLHILKRCYTFAAVKRLAISYQGNDCMQGNLNFFAIFCTNYLVVPNNLLLSLSLLRAREAWRNPCKQRTSRSFLCSLFYALLSTLQRGVFHELFSQNIAIMNQKQLERRAYAKPTINVCVLQTEYFICQSPNVTPGGTSFQEDEWEDKGDIDAGEFETE